MLEFVTIHVPLLPNMQAPSIAGDIRITEDIVEEGIISVDSETRLSRGMKLRAVAEPLASGELYACRFVPAEEVAA